ncbi:MAG: DUF429 domain-containing protein [Anaerolineaceae bacterium]|nr:DUF429 domain-containing protein [Anaerolineaceae bacterium]
MEAAPHSERFIGVDLRSSRQPFTYAALDGERNLLAMGQGDLADVMAFIGGQSSAIIGINAPACLSQGLLQESEMRPQTSPLPPSKRWIKSRRVEYELHLEGLLITRTPASLTECPRWMQRGFQLYHHLQQMGYSPFTRQNASRCWLETPAEAAFHRLMGQKPLPPGTLESRLQRQLALYEHNLPVPDPMRFFEEITRHRLLRGILPLEHLFTAAELNAMVIAYTAWLAVHRPQQVTRWGAPEEGVIVLPAQTKQSGSGLSG